MLKVGEKVPFAKFKHMTAEGMKDLTTDELFKGKRVVVFGLPGAFTPTCSAKHLPGYVEQSDALKARGVQTVACVSVNDAFVMSAWGRNQNVGDKVLMLADGNAEFARAAGLELDRRENGMGIRMQRFSMLVEDGVVKTLNVEKPGSFEVSDAGTMLKQV